MVGFSRGGYIVMEIARELNKKGIRCDCKTYFPKVRFLGLYDPVDSAPGYGDAETVPGNVRYAELVLADSKTGYPKSRGYFNRADHGPESKQTAFHETRLLGTHSALGGSPWQGDDPGGAHSFKHDIKMAIKSDQAVRKHARKAGVKIPLISDYGYKVR